MTPRLTCTSVTPSTVLTSRRVSAVIVSFKGHPATVRSTSTLTTPSSAMSTEETIPRSVMGRCSSGSMTLASASMTAS